MIKIWGRTDSSNVQKVLWCCGELDIEFERVDWGGKFGGNNDEAYREMNPNGLVPTIKDGERKVPAVREETLAVALELQADSMQEIERILRQATGALDGHFQRRITAL